MDNVFIIVPTLNPNKEIFGKFLSELTKEFKNILVYDDGCRDEYDDFFKGLEKQNILVLHHYINLGKGRAMKDAFNYLLEKYPNLKGVVTADSDGQHRVKDIKKVAEEVLKYPDSLIMGCRNFNDKNVPSRNKFGNKTTRAVMKAFIGVSVTDTQTGLRGLPKEVMVKFMTTSGDHFEYETNQLIDTISKEVPIKEVAIETIYVSGNSESHFNPLKDSFAIYKLFFKYILSSVSSFIIDILLYALFIKIIPGGDITFGSFSLTIILATILSRVLSSIYNFTINAKMVFKNKNKSSKIKYFILVVVQMFVSALSVDLLAHFFGIADSNTVPLKLAVDAIIFLINFVIQREFIFIGETNENK